MDPVTLTAVVSGITVLAGEVARGTASEVGKTIWERIETLFGWKNSAKDPHLKPKLEAVLPARPDLAAQVVTLLQSLEDGCTAQALVHNLNAKNIGALEVRGDQHNTFQ